MYLSYSGFKVYEQCPRYYYHKYVKKTALLQPDNRVGMLYGSVVGVLFEEFYQNQTWKAENPLEVLLARVSPVLEKTIAREISKGGIFDWSESRVYSSVGDVETAVRETIPRGLSAIRLHRLVGRQATAEMKLDSKVGEHLLAGRADFVIRRHKHEDLVLLDGKGSRWRDKYVDRRQLKWYAMLFQEKFSTLPDRLGFLYWQSEPADSIDWVEYTLNDITVLRETVLNSVSEIEAGAWQMAQVNSEGDRERLYKAFPTRPSRECSLCSFRELCEEGKAYLSRIPPPIEAGVGVEDVGL
jgi:hypothetical protein